MVPGRLEAAELVTSAQDATRNACFCTPGILRMNPARPDYGAKEAAGMSPPPTIYTPPSELDGTVTGVIITAVVAALALALLIGLVYWANNHPEVRKPGAQQPENGHRPAPTAEPRSTVPGPEVPSRSPLRASAESSPAQARESADSQPVDMPRHP
jgi:hypothetical protein